MTDITPDLVLRAYTIGYFPMAERRQDSEIFWVCPHHRGIIPLDQVHIPRKLRRFCETHPYQITCNQDFTGVITGCAEAKPKRPDTWINPAIQALFLALHHSGHAHSIEIWEASGGNRKLMGGLYGIAMGGAFFGESMFSRADNTSKLALLHLCARLRFSGFTLLDTQFITKHLTQFGAIEIGKDDYLEMLQDALSIPAQFYSGAADFDWLRLLLQPNNTTS
jgi:leucyl/phenylalanyl-tRNA---protein transferase